MSAARGQLASVLRWHRRLPRGQPGDGVQDAVAQGLGFTAGQVAVQGEQPKPGQQDGGGCALEAVTRRCNEYQKAASRAASGRKQLMSSRFVDLDLKSNYSQLNLKSFHLACKFL